MIEMQKLQAAKRPMMFLAGWIVLATLPCCKKPQPPPPVVHVAPVFTRPYEDGYKAGFDKGQADARPRAKLPSEEDVAVKATEAAAADEAHAEKWQHGWAEGYMAGFRDVATHQK
jgi:hypothetical protein